MHFSRRVTVSAALSAVWLLAAAAGLSACGGAASAPNSAPVAKVTAHSVTLNWSASSTAGVSYNVYRSSASGGPYTRLNAAPVAQTAYTDSTVQSGSTYYYVTTAINSGGVESAYSNQVTVAIP